MLSPWTEHGSSESVHRKTVTAIVKVEEMKRLVAAMSKHNPYRWFACGERMGSSEMTSCTKVGWRLWLCGVRVEESGVCKCGLLEEKQKEVSVVITSSRKFQGMSAGLGITNW